MLHCIWLGPLTDAVQERVDHFREMAPGWQVMLHTTESDLRPEYQATYERYAKSPQMKSDFLRHSILQKYGGLYLDIDTILVGTADDVLEHCDLGRYNFAVLNKGGYYNPDFLYCPAGWDGWPVVNSYFREFATYRKPLRNVAFACDLLKHLVAEAPEKVNIIRDLERFARHYFEKGHSGLALRSEADWRRMIANYWGMCSHVDTHVGSILR